MHAPEELATNRLNLRRYRPEDAASIFECYARDEDVTRFLTWQTHKSVEETEAFVRERMEAWGRGDDFTWAITTKDGDLIGGIGLRIRGFKANFGYVMGRPYWNRGYGGESKIVQIRADGEATFIFFARLGNLSAAIWHCISKGVRDGRTDCTC